MELQAMQKKLEQQLLANSALQLKDVHTFSIPLHTVEVSYNPVMRSAMDILMKIMLITFQRTPIKNVELVADILFVEPLFIKDLTSKMQKLGLLTFDEHYQLTTKGERQLETGIFEDELEETTQILQYSGMHEAYLDGDLDTILDLEDYPAVSPYAKEDIDTIDSTITTTFLQTQQLQAEEGEQQIYITSFNKIDIVQVNDSPCIQFILYEEKNKKYIVRVYNVFTNSWDEKLEQLVREHELATYQERFK